MSHVPLSWLPRVEPTERPERSNMLLPLYKVATLLNALPKPSRSKAVVRVSASRAAFRQERGARPPPLKIASERGDRLFSRESAETHCGVRESMSGLQFLKSERKALSLALCKTWPSLLILLLQLRRVAEHASPTAKVLWPLPCQAIGIFLKIRIVWVVFVFLVIYALYAMSRI